MREHDKLTTMLNIIFFLIIFLFVAPGKAQAYLDPGTGSYLTQVIIGFVVGGGYLAKVYWNQIKEKIKSATKKKDHEDQKK